MEKEELLGLGISEEVAEKIIGEREALREEYEVKINELKRENEIDIILREQGAKNIRAVKALIEPGDARDVKSQIEKMKKDEGTRFLFNTGKSFIPYEGGGKLPDTKADGFEARLKEAREHHNTVEAIRIKQEAAKEGIFLI